MVLSDVLGRTLDRYIHLLRDYHATVVTWSCSDCVEGRVRMYETEDDIIFDRRSERSEVKPNGWTMYPRTLEDGTWLQNTNKKLQLIIPFCWIDLTLEDSSTGNEELSIRRFTEMQVEFTNQRINFHRTQKTLRRILKMHWLDRRTKLGTWPQRGKSDTPCTTRRLTEEQI